MTWAAPQQSIHFRSAGDERCTGLEAVGRQRLCGDQDVAGGAVGEQVQVTDNKFALFELAHRS